MKGYFWTIMTICLLVGAGKADEWWLRLILLILGGAALGVFEWVATKGGEE